MKQSEQLNELATALVAAQQQMPSIEKDATGHGYRYASLDNIMAKVRPVLASHGLVILQQPTSPDTEGMGLTTRLLHASGQWVEETVYAPRDEGQRRNSVQAAGSTITYLRRYGIAALLGLADETDTDAAPAHQPSRQNQDTRGESAPQEQAKRQRPTANGSPPPMPTEAMKRKFHALGVAIYGDAWDDKRLELTRHISGKRKSGPVVDSSNALYLSEMQALIDGLEKQSAAA